MSLENRLLESNTKAINRNQEILNRDFKHVTCDQKYLSELKYFEMEIIKIELAIASLGDLKQDAFLKLYSNIHFKLEELHTTYHAKKAIAQYTMHYIQNLEVILQNKIKLFHLKQKHG